jgi:hypothetical protein
MTCQSDLKWSGRRPTCTGELHGFSFVFLVLSFQFSALSTLAPNDFHKLTVAKA